jgi:acetyl esterase/lipase
MVALLLAGLVLGAASVSAEVHVVERRDVPYARGVALDEYLPVRPAGPVPAVLLIHGGGWRTGDKHGWARWARDLVERTGWAAFAVNYDLDASRPYRTQPRNVRAAIDWVRTHAADLGVDADHLGLIGSSAGGHQAMLVATSGAPVSAVVSWSGVSDLPRLERAPHGDPVVQRLAVRFEHAPLDARPARWVDDSPVAHVDPSDPPMALFGSADETIVPIDQLVAMRDALRANGVEEHSRILPGTRHASAFAADVWDETVQFLRQHL